MKLQSAGGTISQKEANKEIWNRPKNQFKLANVFNSHIEQISKRLKSFDMMENKVKSTQDLTFINTDKDKRQTSKQTAKENK